MRRRTYRVRGTVQRKVQITRQVRLRPVMTYTQPVLHISPGTAVAEFASQECAEHHQQPTITVDASGTHVEACCDNFRTHIEALLAA